MPATAGTPHVFRSSLVLSHSLLLFFPCLVISSIATTLVDLLPLVAERNIFAPEKLRLAVKMELLEGQASDYAPPVEVDSEDE